MFLRCSSVVFARAIFHLLGGGGEREGGEGGGGREGAGGHIFR